MLNYRKLLDFFKKKVISHDTVNEGGGAGGIGTPVYPTSMEGIPTFKIQFPTITCVCGRETKLQVVTHSDGCGGN